MPSKVRHEMRFLDPTEVARLSGVIDARYRAFVTRGAFSGLRAGEMIGLRIKNVDVLRRQIEVTEQLQEVRGHLKFGPPKTDTSYRRVSVPPFVIEALCGHLAGRGRDETVFVTPRGGLIRLSQFRARI